MNITLWIIQGLLGAIFIMAGIMKTLTPREKLAEKMPWAKDVSDGQLKLIGLLELLGGIGVVLPGAIGVAPILTPIAAICLCITMIGAGWVHYKRNEMGSIGINAVIFGMAAFVAVGRMCCCCAGVCAI